MLSTNCTIAAGPKRMAVQLLPDVLWPKAWVYPGSCADGARASIDGEPLPGLCAAAEAVRIKTPTSAATFCNCVALQLCNFATL